MNDFAAYCALFIRIPVRGGRQRFLRPIAAAHPHKRRRFPERLIAGPFHDAPP